MNVIPMKMTRTLAKTLALAAACVVWAGCPSSDAPSSAAPAQSGEASGEAAPPGPAASAGEEQAADEAPASQPSGLVEVSAEGTEFDPPVSKDRVPDGVWICDMGTVHYARAEQGDGTCPLCNMRLVQHGAANSDGHEGLGHEGHDHGDDGHEGHDHGSGEQGELQQEMQQHDGIMQHVRAEGTYDPAEVQRQPGAELGGLAACPISGEVFEITEDHAYLEHEGQDVFFCCPSCIRRFQRDPERYLEEAG